jgi:hypothetical protein
MDCFGLSDVNPKRGISWGRSVLTRTLALWWTPRRKIPHPVAVMKTTTTTAAAFENEMMESEPIHNNYCKFKTNQDNHYK